MWRDKWLASVISTLIQMQWDKQKVAFQSFYLLTWKSLFESILWNLIQSEGAWRAYSTFPPLFTPFRHPERVYLPPQLIKSHSKAKCDTRPLIMTPEQRAQKEIIQINKLARTNREGKKVIPPEQLRIWSEVSAWRCSASISHLHHSTVCNINFWVYCLLEVQSMKSH